MTVLIMVENRVGEKGGLPVFLVLFFEFVLECFAMKFCSKSVKIIEK